MTLSVRIRTDFDLTPYNTMGIAAKCDFFAEVRNESQLVELIEDGRFDDVQTIMIGGGSNILFREDYHGLVIYNNIKGIDVIEEDDDEVYLAVGAGENWHELVTYAIDRGWGGIENLALIPGSVGAAPIQNIGAYGVELETVFVKLDAIHRETAEKRTFTKDECNFSYRNSIFKNTEKGKYFISRVYLKLQKKPKLDMSYQSLRELLEVKGIQEPDIRDIYDSVIEIRQSKLPDPNELANTGSFFKNPVIDEHSFSRLKEQYPSVPHYKSEGGIKIPAGWLIEQAGWKGHRTGDAGVHKHQALVLVNYGEATGEDILMLARNIGRSVQEKFEIELEPEVNII